MTLNKKRELPKRPARKQRNPLYIPTAADRAALAGNLEEMSPPAPGHNPHRLSPAQMCFVVEYLVDNNGTRAAKVAGYATKTAAEAASRMLKSRKVCAELADRLKPALVKAELSAARTLEEIGRIAYCDPGGLFDEHGRLRHLKDMPKELRAAIASVEVIKENVKTGDGIVDEVYKIKFWNKNQALELSARHFALLNDTLAIVDGSGIVARLNKGRAHVAAMKEKR